MPRTRASVPMIALLALAAALVAAAAVLLVGPAGSVPAGSGSGSGGGASGSSELTIELPAIVWGLLFLSPLIAFFGVMIYRRITEGGQTRWDALLVLVIVGLLMLFLLAHGGGGGGSGSISFGTQGGTGNNSSGNVSTGNNTSHGGGGGGSGANGTTTAPLTFSIPPYVYWLAGLGLCVTVAALTLPGVASRLAQGRLLSRSGGGTGHGSEREQVASAMGEAAAALEQGADPRETIVQLYLDLLRVMSPLTGELSYETAEEIRRLHLGPLGVPPAVAETLTRLFEEARYSTHPLEASSVAQAQEAIRQAEAALRARGTAG